MRLLILISAITLASCQASIPTGVYLQLPPDLELPTIPSGLECLPGEAYEALVQRDRLQTERRNTLRAIIEANNGNL
jgi:hypothetical protein